MNRLKSHSICYKVILRCNCHMLGVYRRNSKQSRLHGRGKNAIYKNVFAKTLELPDKKIARRI